MVAAGEEFLKNCLLVDIEVNETGEIYSIGAALRSEQFRITFGRKVTKSDLLALNDFGRNAEFVLGHNIIIHDIPRLLQLDASLEVLKKPAIDTLFISPQAFPANPYHRLIKDYKIVRDSVNPTL